MKSLCGYAAVCAFALSLTASGAAHYERFCTSFDRIYRTPAQPVTIPANIYRAYMIGGIHWPQLRWAANVYVMYAYTRDKPMDLEALMRTAPDAELLLKTAGTMDGLHGKFKIDMQVVGTKTQMLYNEWHKTKRRVLWTYFCLNNVLEAIPVEDVGGIYAFGSPIEKYATCAKEIMQNCAGESELLRATYRGDIDFTQAYDAQRLFLQYGVSTVAGLRDALETQVAEKITEATGCGFIW